jgi:pSer/pThr/pTyr-binding forkhead associated (FHA) protein
MTKMQINVLLNNEIKNSYIIDSNDVVVGSEFLIGRADDCHIQIDDRQVSRYNVAISVKEDAVVVKKLAELSDVLLNGSPISDEIKLKNKDQIGVADYVITIDSIDEIHEVYNKFKEIPEDDIPETEQLEDETILLDEKVDDTFSPLDESQEAKEEEQSSLSSDDEINEEQVDPPLDFDQDLTEESDQKNEAEQDFLSDDETPDESSFDDTPLDEGQNQDLEDDFDNDLNSDFNEAETMEFSDQNESENEFGDDDFDNSAMEEAFGDQALENDSFGDDTGFSGGDDSLGDSTQMITGFANFFLTLEGIDVPFDRYKIENNETFIGRDPEKCQIILTDSEASGVHAVIKKSMINCTLEDLNSSNGTVYNGERVNKAELKNGDVFEIGNVKFTFNIDNEQLKEGEDSLMPVDLDQEIEVQDIVELGDLDDEFDFGEDVESATGLKGMWQDPKKRKKLIIYGVLGAVLLLLLEDPEQTTVTETESPKSKTKKTAKSASPGAKSVKTKKVLPPDIIEELEKNYALAISKYEQNDFISAKDYIDKIRAIDPEYRDVQSIALAVGEALEAIKKQKEDAQAEIERRKRQLEVEQLLDKAREAVKERKVELSRSLFSQILEKDPENLDVPQLKLELDAYVTAKQKREAEEARKKTLRQSMVNKLAPGKNYYLKEEWFKAIRALEKFLLEKDIDEDLIEDATVMLKDAKDKLRQKVAPLLGKARSYAEGQDLKRAYEAYGDVLRIDPTNEEALDRMDQIKETLDTRSKRIYREALISESLSLFEDAKTKLLEVQQISPKNSEYYNKATDRLKDYLE